MIMINIKELNIKLSCDIDPIVSYKGRYNRNSYKRLVKYGTLFKLIDCNHWLFDKDLRTLQEGDVIQSYNDAIVYVIIRAVKNENGQTKWIDYQPLFCEYNFRIGLLECILSDGFDNPFIK